MIMNKLVLACITTTITTLIVLIINPQAPQKVQFTSVNLGYKQVTTVQNTQTAIHNIDNTTNKNISIQYADRNSYMNNLKSKNQNKIQNVAIDERLTKQKIIKEANEQKLRKQREDIVRQQVEDQIQQQAKEKTIEPYTKDEIIAWNKWRAKLANEILNKANSYPGIHTERVGERYRISFDVDKYRRITNVSVQVDTYDNETIKKSQTYINAIRRAIGEIDGTKVLTFPQGSQRITTKFNANIKSVPIETPMKWAHPKDYNDYEFNKKTYYKYQ